MAPPVHLTRLQAGHYYAGQLGPVRVFIRDTYDPSGAPHTRAVTLTRDRWLVSLDAAPAGRFDTLRQARAWVAGKVEAHARARAL